MAIDPNILLSTTPIKYPDLVEQRAKALQLQSLQQGNQLGQQQLQEGQLKLQQQQEINQAYQSAYKSDPATGKVSLDQDALTKALATSGHAATAIPGIVDSLAKAQEAKNAVIEGTQKIQTAADDHLAFTANAIIKAQGDPALAMTQLQNEYSLNKDPKIAQAIQAIQQNPTPQTVQQVVTPFVQSSPGALKVLAEQQQADARAKASQTGADRLAAEKPGIAAKADAAVISNARQALSAAPTPEEYANIWGQLPARIAMALPRPGSNPDFNALRQQAGLTSEQNVQATQRATTEKREASQGAQRLNIEGARLAIEQQADAAGAQLTPEAKEQAAQLYLKTGTLPPMGMGKAGAAVRTGILNRAAEVAPGADIGSNKASYGADAGSLKKLQSQRDNIGAFENTAGKNLDLFIGAASKIPDTGSPLLNTPLRLVNDKLLGSDFQAAANAARQVATNEIAKVTSNPNLSGALSDSARHEVEAFNPANATFKQTLAIAKILKQDMANRKTSLDDAITEVKGRISGKPAATSAPPSAPEVYVRDKSGKLVKQQ